MLPCSSPSPSRSGPSDDPNESVTPASNQQIAPALRPARPPPAGAGKAEEGAGRVAARGGQQAPPRPPASASGQGEDEVVEQRLLRLRREGAPAPGHAARGPREAALGTLGGGR